MCNLFLTISRVCARISSKLRVELEIRATSLKISSPRAVSCIIRTSLPITGNGKLFLAKGPAVKSSVLSGHLFPAMILTHPIEHQLPPGLGLLVGRQCFAQGSHEVF